MNVTENIRIAFRGLSANKLRAALTMLGIMIGVAAVITLMAIGDGVNRFVADQFIGLGTNLVFVVPNEDPFRAEPSISMADAQALADIARVPGVVASAPLYNRNAEVVYGRNADTVPIQASTPDYSEIRGYEIERGRFFGDTDYNGRSRVVVLGAETVENLYPEDIDPLETDVKIDGINFRVIGILEEQGGGLFGSQDNLLILPLTTAQERLFNARSRRTGELLVDTILLQAVSSEAVQDVVIDATETLRQTHNISFRDEDDFVVLTQEDFLDTFGQVIGVLTLFLGSIAGISLLVGGIGIMNIMLVTVTERTREIGLRKAVGAKRSDILGQFLTEAIILSIVGGLLGILLGFLGATVIQLAVPDLETSITAGAVTLAVGFSAAVGLFFGIYPASRAAALDPIEALRFE
ncbi:MAG: ABC transporter permease [Chloroflexota bacterium]|nr:MAG: ABC transporter permease [Chloroflexota bacterium]